MVVVMVDENGKTIRRVKGILAQMVENCAATEPKKCRANPLPFVISQMKHLRKKPFAVQIGVGVGAGGLTGFIFTKCGKLVAAVFGCSLIVTQIRYCLNYILVPVSLYLTGHLVNKAFEYVNGKPLILRDRTVLITGASSGLGRALAISLHKRGARVILTARKIDQLKELCDELKSIPGVQNPHEPSYHYLDLANPADLDSIVALSPNQTIDVLINNAGVSMRGSCRDTPINVHRQVMEVNFFGHIAITKALLDYIPDDGAIVYISSVQGRIAVPFRCAYSASKHAAQAFFDCLRCEENHGRQILVVSAAYMNTGFGRRALNVEGKPVEKDDPNQAKGLQADEAAEKIVKALVARKNELVLAPLVYRLAVFLRWFCPNLLFYILRRRGLKDGSVKSKGM